ncbi:holo-ACP synthase [Brevibacterium litoralis]|uniref:holo-ACP synthase n=1 Tax=Brevibacterium litoralis TaxID=3138935 RepID=UPI0032EAC184
MAIMGIGLDIADVPRFQEHVERVPELLDRLLTPREQLKRNGKRRTYESLAARFSAKEALTKAIRYPGWMNWQHAEVVSAPSGAPSFRLSGPVLEHFRSIGADRLHLSITHDANVTMTYVICEGDGEPLSPPVDQPLPPMPGRPLED